MGCRKPIKHLKRKDQSYGFMCIFNSYLSHHNRACEVEGIDVVLRGIKDHKKMHIWSTDSLFLLTN